MTRQVRRVAIVLFLLFGALFVNLNFLQVLRADDLSNDTRNSRKIIAEYSIRRGSIVAGKGGDTTVLAESVATDGGRFEYRRRYPEPELYAHVTGFYSLLYGRAGLEDTANGFLVGDAPEQFARNVGDLLTGREPEGDDVVVTLRPEVQRAAREALGDRVGAVVALAPQTGAVLALWANPSYDPNRLATFDRARAVRYWERSENERRNRALRETYPPGSTFKVITAAAALEDGIDPDDTFDDPSGYTPPQTTATIPNFGGGLCNGGSPITLARAFEVSCNTTFAQLGVDIGAAKLVEQAEAFGFNQTFDLGLPMAASVIPSELDPPSTAQSAIGQRDVRATPLQMAMVSAAVANDGVLMRPHVIARVEDFAGRVVRQITPSMLVLDGQDDARAVSRETAQALQDMMLGVVTNGSGGAAAVPGVEVAGKTGTAQTAEGANPTVWFTGFAPFDDPQVAVAVVLPDGGDVGSEATGGAVAAPIAGKVIDAAVGE